MQASDEQAKRDAAPDALAPEAAFAVQTSEPRIDDDAVPVEPDVARDSEDDAEPAPDAGDVPVTALSIDDKPDGFGPDDAGSLSADQINDSETEIAPPSDLGEIRLDDTWREEPTRPLIERIRPAIGLTAALVLHVGVAAAGYASFATITERIGAGGTDETSISVELITREALDAVRAERRTQNTQTTAAPTPERLAPVAGAETPQSAQLQTQDGAPPTTPAKAEPQAQERTAPIVAKPPPSIVRDGLTVAAQRGQNQSGEEAAPPEPSESQPTEPRRDQPDAKPETPEPVQLRPTQSQAASQAQDAQAETAKGGALSRSLRLAAVPPTQPSAAEAARAAGRAARGYAADLVKALVQLEDHLQARNAVRGERTRGRVELLLRLGTNGQIETLRVAQSSGNRTLDQQAVRDVRLFRFPTPPPMLSASQRTFQLPITYR